MAKKKIKDESVVAYKGFNQNMQCRSYQFKIGETFNHEGEVKACAGGFHSCEYPLDVFGYYAPADSRYAVVAASGKLSRDGDDSKIASATITIQAEINIPQLITKAIDWVKERIDCSLEQSMMEGTRSAASNTGYQSAASNTGARSAASNTGYQSAASNTGARSAASNTGARSAASNTGARSAASNTGDYSAASNTGDYSAASNTGYQSAASNTGYQSAASNTGYQSAASNTGARSAASNTGYQSAASNTGYQSAASNTGARSAAEVSGNGSVAAAYGIHGRARASEGGAIVLCYRDDEGELIHIRASKVGENGVEADTWYELDASGDFFKSDKEPR